MDLFTAIRDVVHEILRVEPLTRVQYGTYTGTVMRIDALPLDIPMDMIEIPPSLQTIEATISCELTEGQGVEITGTGTVRKIKLTDVPVTITRGLKPGDKVTLLRHCGGQRFSVLDKI
ncbi:DUF2577 family protein [Oscillospiraceae bacterium LTW-04]|nr:DUF2577 family protein [Oscillospiraceae bacterium MB24-C1]